MTQIGRRQIGRFGEPRSIFIGATSESHRRVKFFVRHLETILEMEVLPMVDQIEINPGFLQRETVDFCQKQGIIVEAWSPLGRGRIFDDPTFAVLGK